MKALSTSLFWLLSFTWGLPLTLIGLLCSSVLLITGHKPKRFHHFLYFEVGEDWGGLEGGCFFVVCKDASLFLKQHEAGHGLVNIILGPFSLLLITLPSCIRYWYRDYVVSMGEKTRAELPPYYSIWFERWPSNLGAKYYPGNQ